MSTETPPYPYLVRWYAENVKPHSRGKPAVWGDAWIKETIRFGWKVVLVALLLLAGCIFLPNDGRRWFFLAIGVCLFGVGTWHVRNAHAICELALKLPRNQA